MIDNKNRVIRGLPVKPVSDSDIKFLENMLDSIDVKRAVKIGYIHKKRRKS